MSEELEEAAPPPPGAVSPPAAIVRGVIDGLYEGRFAPGQRLVEADLVARFGASRGSVREALARLEAAGVVRLTRNKGASVRMLSRREARDIIVLSEVLNGLIFRLAAENIARPGVAKQAQSAYEQLQSSRSAPKFIDQVRARNAYYRVLVEIGGNREIARVLPMTDVHLTRTQFRGYDFAYERERFDLYEDLHEAILGGDGVRAEALGRARSRLFLKDLETLPDHAFANEDELES